MTKTDSSKRTVGELLDKCAEFPGPGKPPVKVGERSYPRYSSDAVPALVKDAVARLKDRLEAEGRLEATDAKAKRSALRKLVNEVWPKPHYGTHTSERHAAKYVQDWATQNGITIKLPEGYKKR
jgi:ribosomal protein L17